MKLIKGEDDFLELLTAKEAMINPILLYEDDDIRTIIEKLKKEEINVCIIINKKGEFIGQINDGDIIKLFLQQIKKEPLTKLNMGYINNIIYKKAKDLTNKHKSTTKSNTPINKVIELIFKEGFNYIPIINNQNKVIGVVTASSIINLLKDR